MPSGSAATPRGRRNDPGQTVEPGFLICGPENPGSHVEHEVWLSYAKRRDRNSLLGQQG